MCNEIFNSRLGTVIGVTKFRQLGGKAKLSKIPLDLIFYFSKT